MGGGRKIVYFFHPGYSFRRTGPLHLGDLDAVIVDFDDVLAILRARPDLKIVGVNATNSAVTVLSRRIYLAHTLTDVVRCLE